MWRSCFVGPVYVFSPLAVPSKNCEEPAILQRGLLECLQIPNVVFCYYIPRETEYGWEHDMHLPWKNRLEFNRW